MKDIKLTQKEHAQVLDHCSMLGHDRASALSILHFVKLHRRRLTNSIIEKIAGRINHTDELKAVSSKYVKDSIIYTAEFTGTRPLSWEIK